MNTPDNWQIYATTTDPTRAAGWIKVTGENKLPVKSASPILTFVPGEADPVLAYRIDLAALTREQFERLADSLAETTAYPYDDLLDLLRSNGLATHAKNVTITITDPQLLAYPLSDLDDEYNWMSDEGDEETF